MKSNRISERWTKTYSAAGGSIVGDVDAFADDIAEETVRILLSENNKDDLQFSIMETVCSCLERYDITE